VLAGRSRAAWFWIPLCAMLSVVATLTTVLFLGVSALSADTPEELDAATGLSNWFLQLLRLGCLAATIAWIGATVLAKRRDSRWRLLVALSIAASAAVTSWYWL
jgi:hypothetical protein